MARLRHNSEHHAYILMYDCLHTNDDRTKYDEKETQTKLNDLASIIIIMITETHTHSILWPTCFIQYKKKIFDLVSKYFHNKIIMLTLSKNQKNVGILITAKQAMKTCLKNFFLYNFTEYGHLRNSKYHLLAILSTHSLFIYI